MKDTTGLRQGTKRRIFISLASGFIGGVLAVIITYIIVSMLHLPDKMILTIVIVIGAGLAVTIWWLIRKHPLLTLSMAAIILLFIGVAIIFSSYFPDVWAQVKWDSTAVGLVTSIIGISIAGLALRLSLESGETIKSMANLEFHEKIAVMEAYISKILRSDIRKRTSAEDEERVKHILKANAERIYHDIKGAAQLKNHVDPEVNREINQEIDKLKNIASEQKEQYQELIDKLDLLQREDAA